VNRAGRTLGIVLMLCGLCAALGYVVGQRNSATEPEGGQHLPRLIEELDLRADQIERIDQLLMSHDAEVGLLVESHREQLRQPLAESLDRTESGILAVLDEAQRSRYLELNRD
jgi:hypothetical protein